MCEFIIDNRTCLIPSGTNALCHVHRKSAKLAKKVVDQAAEIKILNARLSLASRKLQIIHELDRIKYELAPISKFCSYRHTINDPDNKSEVERVFGCSQAEALDVYNELLTKRNMICHRFTSRDWAGPVLRPKWSKNVKKIVKSIKCHEILNT